MWILSGLFGGFLAVILLPAMHAILDFLFEPFGGDKEDDKSEDSTNMLFFD